MPTFEDKNGKQWKIGLDVGLVEEIKDQTEIDLDDLLKEKSKLSELIFDSPKKIVQIMYVMCEDEIKKIPLTPREFARVFDRETIDRASEAFIQSIMLFYPRTSAGKVLVEQFPQLIAKMDRTIEKETRKKLDKALSDMDTVSLD